MQSVRSVNHNRVAATVAPATAKAPHRTSAAKTPPKPLVDPALRAQFNQVITKKDKKKRVTEGELFAGVALHRVVKHAGEAMGQKFKEMLVYTRKSGDKLYTATRRALEAGSGGGRAAAGRGRERLARGHPAPGDRHTGGCGSVGGGETLALTRQQSWPPSTRSRSWRSEGAPADLNIPIREKVPRLVAIRPAFRGREGVAELQGFRPGGESNVEDRLPQRPAPDLRGRDDVAGVVAVELLAVDGLGYQRVGGARRDPPANPQASGKFFPGPRLDQAGAGAGA